MRKVLFCGLWLLAGAVAMPALADSLDIHENNGQGSLAWHEAGHALVLSAGDQRGIRVVEARPSGELGLRTADTILAVDGHPVNSITALLHALRASRSGTAQLLLRRDGTQQVVPVAASGYMRFMPPKPPAPPAPPAPPPIPPAGG